MKKLILAGLMAVSGLSAAQQTKNFQTSGYDGISVAGPYTVVLSDGKEGNITATGEADDLEALIVESDGKNLTIKPEKGWKNRPKRNVRITIPFESINAVKLAGSGSITSSELISATNLSIALAGSGHISLKAKADTIDAKISGSGDLELSGNTTKVETNLSGSGEIHAFGLYSAIAEANISGSGNCEINCSEQITARISGSGNIVYKGNPDVEDTKVSGSGRITKS